MAQRAVAAMGAGLGVGQEVEMAMAAAAGGVALRVTAAVGATGAGWVVELTAEVQVARGVVKGLVTWAVKATAMGFEPGCCCAAHEPLTTLPPVQKVGCTILLQLLYCIDMSSQLFVTQCSARSITLAESARHRSVDTTAVARLERAFVIFRMTAATRASAQQWRPMAT